MKKWLFLLGLGFCTGVLAEIYRQVDAEGHVTFSSLPGPGAVRLDLPPRIQAPRAAPAREPPPEGVRVPREGAQTQQRREDRRRQILEAELGSERKALAEARKKYAGVTTQGEAAQRLQQEVLLHEKNIHLLGQELAAAR